MFKRISPWLWVLAAIVGSRLITMALLPLIDTTEPRYAEIARMMAASGDWVTPWFKEGVPFWAKPPLSFWAQAGAIKLLGMSAFVIRLPSWLCTLAILALSWRYARAVADARTARLTVLVLATMALTYVSAGTVMTDSFLVLGTTMSLVSFGMVLLEQGRYWRWAFFAGLVISLLAKGPLALVLIGLPVALWVLLNGRLLWCLRAFPWPSGLLLTAVLTLPWYVLAELKTPGFIDYFIVGEHFRRFVDPGWAGDLYGSAHVEPRGMIWAFWSWATFPWGIVAIALLAFSSRLRRSFTEAVAGSERRHYAFIALAALTPLLFFTFAGNILWTYVLPGLPFIAILIARGLVVPLIASGGWWLRVVPALLMLVPCAVTIAGVELSFQDDSFRSEERLVSVYQAHAEPGDSALLYLGEPPFSAQFYARGGVRQVAMAELLRSHWQSAAQRVFVAVRHRELDEVLPLLPADTQVLTRNVRYALLSYSNPLLPVYSHE